jgi:hypothetical protein
MKIENSIVSRFLSPAHKAGLIALAAAATFAVSGPLMAAPVAAANPASAVTSDLSAYTTGDGAIYVVITLRDGAMAPVAGKTVAMAITAQRGGKADRNVTVTNTNGTNVTDALGHVSFKLSSSRTVYDYGKAVDSSDSITLPQTLLVDLPTARY